MLSTLNKNQSYCRASRNKLRKLLFTRHLRCLQVVSTIYWRTIWYGNPPTCTFPFGTLRHPPPWLPGTFTLDGVASSRIDRRIKDIDKQVDDEKHDDDKHNRALHRHDIAVANCLHQVSTEPGPGENFLGYYGPA